ncbi:MAG: hypothetical protein RL011_1103, partial [Pseudomonadota bacterium]
MLPVSNFAVMSGLPVAIATRVAAQLKVPWRPDG